MSDAIFVARVTSVAFIIPFIIQLYAVYTIYSYLHSINIDLHLQVTDGW